MAVNAIQQRYVKSEQIFSNEEYNKKANLARKSGGVSRYERVLAVTMRQNGLNTWYRRQCTFRLDGGARVAECETESGMLTFSRPSQMR